MPLEVFHSFQVTQEKDLFPCLVCCDGPPHEQRDSSWRIGVGCSSGYLPHTAKASVYTALCLCVSVLVCVCVCVGVSSEQSDGLAWHLHNHCPLRPKQATLLLHYAGKAASKTNKPRLAKVPSLQVTAYIIQWFLWTIGNKCWKKMLSQVWLPQNVNV